MAKPTGAICNLDCAYCYYLSKESLYPGDRFRMTLELMETYVRQLMESQTAPEVTVAWQGGEPTLMGLSFFREVVKATRRHRRPGQQVTHTIQTNATLLNEDWAAFLAEEGFLVGVSIDGPPEIHDAYRVDKHGRETSARVIAGLDLLRQHNVKYNILCSVHAANADHPIEVYRYLRDDCGARFIQLIPIVEPLSGDAAPGAVSDRSVTPERWGRFLSAIFDEWLVRDVGSVFVQTFDASLAAWLGVPPGLCVFSETCGDAVALEHNGDVYSCDHFVEPDHLLGNIRQTHLVELVASEQQRAFGAAKRDSLPGFCRRCDVLFVCQGECPKNRFLISPDGEPGLNYLCDGYKQFFHHVDGPMRIMADLLRAGRLAADVMTVFARVPRNALCPCGSGAKAKKCHGDPRGRQMEHAERRHDGSCDGSPSS
jgi:uncharacterized protein